MHCAGRGSLFALALVACAPVRAADSSEQDQFEDKCVARAAERAVRAGKSERAVWMKELEAAFPGKVTDARTEEEYGRWYDLLVGKNEEWKREPANPQLAQLFDKVVQRLELGPVPTIKRDEFARYARKVLRDGNPPRDGERDAHEDADRAFRVLDTNADGALEPDELTAPLREEKVRTDADANGRINRDEYRAYFQKKVTVRTETILARSGESARGPDGKPVAKNDKNGLPDWFVTFDADRDSQVSLFEWRKAGRALAAYQEMDLNGDGLLTRDEYLRYAKTKEVEAAEKRREEAMKP